MYAPDGGKICIHGKEVRFISPKDAIKSGVGTIYQHFKLVEAMTARENINLGLIKGIFQNKAKLDREIKKMCEKFGPEVKLDKYVEDMSVGERQNLEILKVIYRGADILILDEPTAVFTPQETEKLFSIMRKMKAEGCAIIFITHKMDEVMNVCDKITVLRKGEAVANVLKEKTSPKELTDLMVGRSVDLSIKRLDIEPGEKLLQVENLTILNEERAEAIKKVSFDIKAGEIFGIAGIAGCGQKELCEAIAGIYPSKEGEIIFDGDNLKGKNPREFLKRGISMSFIPEDRLGMGLVGSMEMVDNLLIKSYYTQKGILINRKPTETLAKELVKKLEIKTPGINFPIKYLSGGNIQKILLGRELSAYPKLLIMAYPVRGLDINTCYTIYDLINEEKKKGTAVLFVGEDLDVLMELCDRIMVLCDGEVSGIVDGKTATKEKLGLMMVGEKVHEDMEVTPLLFATLGEIITEKVGNLNLGVEGMMLMGSVTGFIVGFQTGNPILAIICAMIAGAFGALIYAYLTVSLRANQVVTGLALTIFGAGFSSVLGKDVVGKIAPETIKSFFTEVKIPLLSDIPFIGEVFFNHDVFVYFSYIVAISLGIYLYNTNKGLNLRAVGENPAAADAASINVSLYKYVHLLLGGALAGLGGAYLSLVYLSAWQENITAGRGWIAVALVIFAAWNPYKAIFGAYLFGGLDIIGFRMGDIMISKYFLDMLPYVVTIIVLVVASVRKSRKNSPPKGLGVGYFREER